MRLPGLQAYYEVLAIEEFNRRAWKKIYRERRREHAAPGPMTRYLPQGGGVYLMTNSWFDPLGYVRRGENGEWVKTEPVPLLPTA